MVMVTELGALTRPLLPVTLKLNVREIIVETGGALKVGLTVLAPFRITKGSEVWVQEYDAIVAPFVAKLPEPSNVTVLP
jgi:hypothetical protein